MLQIVNLVAIFSVLGSRLGFKTCFSKTKTKTKTLRFQDQD